MACPAPPFQTPVVTRDASDTAVVARRAGLLALGTLSSRILGALRDAVIAATFAVAATDAFWLAFTLPNALRVLLGEGAVSAMVVPVFTETRERDGPEAARALYARLAGTMLVVLIAVAALGVVAAPVLVQLYAAGFDASTTAEAISLTRWVFPYIALMGAAALATGALHASGRFLAPAFAPVLLNVAFIAAAFLLRERAVALGLGPVGALALGALLGGALQVLALLPSLRRAGLLVRPRPALGDPAVRRAFRRLAPLLAGLGVYQLNVLMSRQLASFLPEGSLSYLFYGQRLVEIPQGMFALAIGSAALPTLASRQARGDAEGARTLLRYGLRLALFVAIPASVTLALLATPVVGALLGRGAYGAVQVAETARSLVFLAVGVWAVAAVRTVVPMFHALGDTRSPVVASALNLAIFVCLGVGLMGSMQHAGLALAMSVAATAQLALLLALLHRRSGPLGLGEVGASALRSLAAATLAGAVMDRLASAWLASGGDGRVGTTATVLATLGLIAAGALTYLATAAMLRAPELRELAAAFRRR